MKINSRFVDTYDFSEGNSFGDTLVYFRKYSAEKVPLTQNIKDTLPSTKTEWNHTYYRKNLTIGVGDKVFNFLIEAKENTIAIDVSVDPYLGTINERRVTPPKHKYGRGNTDAFVLTPKRTYDTTTKSWIDHAEATGRLQVSTPLIDALKEPLEVANIDEDTFRKYVGTTAPVFVYWSGNLYNNISLMQSELWEAVSKLLSGQEVNTAIENYLIKTKTIADSRNDVQKAESSGFDKKTSFRKRK